MNGPIVTFEDNDFFSPLFPKISSVDRQDSLYWVRTYNSVARVGCLNFLSYDKTNTETRFIDCFPRNSCDPWIPTSHPSVYNSSVSLRSVPTFHDSFIQGEGGVKNVPSLNSKLLKWNNLGKDVLPKARCQRCSRKLKSRNPLIPYKSTSDVKVYHTLTSQ